MIYPSTSYCLDVAPREPKDLAVINKALRLLTLSAVWWGASCHAESIACLIEPDRVADVGANVMGVLEKVTVERGDMVMAGQLLARLSAQVERASVNVAQARSVADAEYKQAVAANVLAQRKLTRAQDLLKQDYVSGQALDQAEAEARVAEQRVAQARESQGVSKKEFQLSAAQLSQREVRSPFDGIVLERYRTEGERIEREPVVRVARVDPLRVETIVPSSLFGTIHAGQLVIVKTDLLLFPAFSARVVLVDQVIDPASNSFRVRLTVPNPNNRIPAGLRCKVNFANNAASDRAEAMR
jgi:RND family efflux transporter MFP subunit